MATDSAAEKWVHPKSAENEVQEDDDDEEEALSLCDLPINNQQNHQSRKEEEEEEAAQPNKPEEDFDFKSWGGSVLTESQMCAADDVFFQGQIIPLRHSISSDGGLMAALSRNTSRSISRSESMDRFHITGINSVNSRSSSIRSLHSSSQSSSTTTTTTTTTTITPTGHKQRVLNQFHSHPSPSPQIRIPSSRYSNSGHRVQKSTIWSFFRVGLLQTPEIELQGLKVRSESRNHNKSNFGSRNSSSSSSSVSSSTSEKKKKKQRFFGNNGGFFSSGSCKCTVDAIETVPLRIVKGENDGAKEEEDDHEKEKAMKEKEKKKKKKKKQAVSHHRTFEWLKELSNAAAVPDEA